MSAIEPDHELFSKDYKPPSKPSGAVAQYKIQDVNNFLQNMPELPLKE